MTSTACVLRTWWLSLLLAPVLASALLPATAAADVPPPDGNKFVSYAFKVEGPRGDLVVFAYPTSASNGAPTAELSVVEGAPIELGRRSGQTKLYAMKRADFEAWKAGYQPNPSAFDDPAVLGLIAKAIPCDLQPTPNFTLPASDLREAVVEEFVLKKLDATTCDLEPKGGASTEGPTTQAGDTQVPRAKGGCASCAIDEGGSRWLGLVSVGAALLIGARRRGARGLRGGARSQG
jgi:hypothetical protein